MFMKRLVIDTETGGLFPREHSLLTIGMVLADFKPRRIKFTHQKHILIKHPEYFVTRSALKINGIDLEQHHKAGVVPKLAHKQMTEFIDEHSLHDMTLLGHNVHFDINFLDAFCAEHALKFPLSREKEDTRYMWEIGRAHV